MLRVIVANCRFSRQCPMYFRRKFKNAKQETSLHNVQNIHKFDPKIVIKFPASTKQNLTSSSQVNRASPIGRWRIGQYRVYLLVDVGLHGLVLVVYHDVRSRQIFSDAGPWLVIGHWVGQVNIEHSVNAYRSIGTKVGITYNIWAETTYKNYFIKTTLVLSIIF